MSFEYYNLCPHTSVFPVLSYFKACDAMLFGTFNLINWFNLLVARKPLYEIWTGKVASPHPRSVYLPASALRCTHNRQHCTRLRLSTQVDDGRSYVRIQSQGWPEWLAPLPGFLILRVLTPPAPRPVATGLSSAHTRPLTCVCLLIYGTWRTVESPRNP